MKRFLLVCLAICLFTGVASAFAQDHMYDLKLLVHANYEQANLSPTNFVDSSRYLRYGQPYNISIATVPVTVPKFGNGTLASAGAGAKSYLEFPDSDDFRTGAQNWSVNMHINQSSATVTYPKILMSQNQTNGRANVWSLLTNTTISYREYVAGTATCQNDVVMPSAIVPNRQYQLTFIRNVSNLANSPVDIYINGLYNGTGACTGDNGDVVANLRIGGENSSVLTGATPFNGYIDELSFWQGGLRRNINFFYPATEYPVYTNTSSWGGYNDDNSTESLLHMDGANGGAVFKDQSGKIWSVNGVTTTTAQAKFAPTGGNFAGAISIINTPNHPDYDFGNGCWTVDAWVNWSSIPDGIGGVFSTITSSGTGYSFYLRSNGKAGISGNASGTPTTDLETDINAVPSGVYTHVAWVRNGTDLSIFVNGQRKAQAVITSGYNFNTYGNMPTVGTYQVDTPGTYYYSGGMDELRITKGAARWSANFTPPTLPYEIANASFTSNELSVSTSPPVVQFTDTSPDSAWTQNVYYWDFGNGNTSTLKNPTNTYSGPGNWTATEYVSNNNMTSSFSKNISIGGPIVDFSCSPLAGTAALQVTCTDLTQNISPISSYLIDFGDGTTSTDKPPWTHVYSTFGSFSLNLTETNPYGTDFNYKRDYIITSTEQNQRNTWYSPHAVEFTVYDSRRNPVVGTRINASADSNTFPEGTDWLVDMYGITPSVANQMMNGTLIMNGTTDSRGSLTFTMLTSIKYIVKVVNPANGQLQTVNVTPLDSMYNIWLTGSTVNDTYMDMGYNTSLYVTEPDVHNVTLNLRYQDMSARTSLLEFFVVARVNNTVINYQSASSFGKGTILMNYTVPNVKPNQYSWYYNAVRVK